MARWMHRKRVTIQRRALTDMPRIWVALLFLAIAIGPVNIEGAGLKKEERGKKITVVGCLVETEGHFTITDEHQHSEFLLMTRGDIDMRASVGHLVRVKGRTADRDDYVPIGGDKGGSRFIGLKVESVSGTKESCDLKLPVPRQFR